MVEFKLEVTKWTELANLRKTMPMKYRRLEFNAQLEATITQLQEDNIRMRDILISLESMATGFIKYKIKEVLGETK